MAYKMTPKRRAALKKAQAVSARKRRGKGKGKLASANRKNSRMKRRVALVAATGGLLGGAMGVAGAYYARKTAGGGPKAPKMSHGNSSRASLERSVQQLSSNVGRVERQLRGAGRVGAPRSRSLKAVGGAFGTQNRWSIKPVRPRKGAPKSGSTRGHGSRVGFDRARHAAEDRAWMQRQDSMWRAQKKRGLLKNTHSKAKYRRRNEAKARKKNS